MIEREWARLRRVLGASVDLHPLRQQRLGALGICAQRRRLLHSRGLSISTPYCLRSCSKLPWPGVSVAHKHVPWPAGWLQTSVRPLPSLTTQQILCSRASSS